MNPTLLSHTPNSLFAHDAPVKMIRFSGSGSLMATGDTELQIKVWSGSEEVSRVDPHSNDDKIRPTENIRGMEFSFDERHLYVAASDTLDAYSTQSGELEWFHRPPRHFGFLIVSPQALAVSLDGTIAASFDYGSISAFSPDGQELWRHRENYAPRYMGFANKGQHLVGADAFNLCLWSAETGELVQRKKVDHKMYSMVVLPGDGMVATRELYTLSVYELAPVQRVFEIPAGRGLPTLAASTKAGLVASGERNRIRVVNLEGQGVQDIHVEANVVSLAFTPNGNKLAAGCSDGYVRTWDVDAVVG